MSILIQGMEMPENCAVCPIRSWNGEDDICPFSKVEALPIGRQVKCPLIEIPLHGRLIDADAIKEKIDHQRPGRMYEDAWALTIIDDAPTVLPADKENF